jgi:hypothetical protein
MREKKSKSKAKASQVSGRCFVLMPFGVPFDRYYKNIFEPGDHKFRFNARQGRQSFQIFSHNGGYLEIREGGEGSSR